MSLFVKTFNEGEELPSGKTKQWTITPSDGQPIAIAVLFEEWTNGDQRLWTFVQVTTPANALISKITDRMPAVLSADDIPIWLGETNVSPGEIKAVLRTFDDQGGWKMEPEQRPGAPLQPTLL